MRNKYYAKKCTVDGLVFDSKKEARRHSELRMMEKAGEIRDLQRQVKFKLIPAQYSKYQMTSRGKPKCIERECSYIADFMYFDVKEGRCIVEDTKGMKTKDYIVKRKLMLFIHGIEIKEV